MTKPMTSNERRLAAFVNHHVQKWLDDRQVNYDSKWDEYERLWLGEWSTEDRTRDSERSKVVTPAIQQAIESWQAEVEEATFGKGGFFDIEDDTFDEDKTDVEVLKLNLQEDLERDGIKSVLSETFLNLGVFGTGVIEIIVEQKKGKRPMTVPSESGMEYVGVEEYEYVCVRPHVVHPRNFVVDPSNGPGDVDGGMGCAVVEFMPAFQVIQDMEKGVYVKRDIGFSPPDDEIEAYKAEESRNDRDVVRITRWYGLVPRDLLEGKDEDYAELFETSEINIEELYEDLVEAVVVLADDGVLLKATKNPYMMGDRPIVGCPADIRPRRFWGRGIAEKGYNMQKVIDAQIRMHLDSSALTAVPMMGVDATRMPRGFKFDIRPGKSILTNGSPNDVLMPLKFGETSSLNVDTANLFERYLLQATGTLDGSAMPDSAANGADSDSMNVALSAIIKRHRRSMTQIQENLIVPLIKKTAYRYMQYDPERYPVKDFKFQPKGTMGIIAREYEQRQYLGMMSTLGPESPIVPILMRGILENSSLHNREQLIAELEKASQPSPEQQMMQQKQQMLLGLQIQEQQMKNAKLAAEAKKTNIEADLAPEELKINMLAALTKNSETETEFGQRVKIAELALKEKEIDLKDQDSQRNFAITQLQMDKDNEVKDADKSSKQNLDAVVKQMSDIQSKMHETVSAEMETEVVRDENGKIKKTIKRRKSK